MRTSFAPDLVYYLSCLKGHRLFPGCWQCVCWRKSLGGRCWSLGSEQLWHRKERRRGGEVKNAEGHPKSQTGEEPQKEDTCEKVTVMEFRINSVSRSGIVLLLILVGTEIRSTAVQVRHYTFYELALQIVSGKKKKKQLHVCTWLMLHCKSFISVQPVIALLDGAFPVYV